jgi:hypothetical protein
MGLEETSRRQKAQAAIQGKNRKVKTIGIVSAQNPMGSTMPKKYNNDAHEELLTYLERGNYRYFVTKGLYDSPETSVIIYNISLKDTLYYGYTFNQESVIWVDMTKDGEISYQYWEGDDKYSPLHKKYEEHEVVDATKDDNYYTQICRKFKFRIPFFDDINRYNRELVECAKIIDVDGYISDFLNESKTGYSKYNHRGIIKKTIKNFRKMNILSECVNNFEKSSARNVGNFLGECYSEKTSNKANLVSLNEVNAKTLIDRHSKDGYVIISPCRGGADFGLDPSNPEDKEKLAHINNERIKDLVNILKQSDFSYTPTYGGFIENQGTPDEENVYERSFVVYNHHKDGSVGDFKELYDFALAMAKKYNQDSVLIKAPNGNPEYVKQDGEVDFGFDGNVAFNDAQQAYFTDLHKNTDKYDMTNRKPTRFSFLESYINPAPQCYGERISRARNGEIFLSK